MASSPRAAVAVAKIDADDKTTDLRLKLKGRLLADLGEYQDAYKIAHGAAIELEALVPHMLAAFIEGDRGFQAWRRQKAGATLGREG